jgi:hypothetical protein
MMPQSEPLGLLKKQQQKHKTKRFTQPCCSTLLERKSNIQSNLSIATTQDHGRVWSLWTGGLYIQVKYIGKTQGGRREQVVVSTGGRYIQVVAKAGLTVHCSLHIHA